MCVHTARLNAFSISNIYDARRQIINALLRMSYFLPSPFINTSKWSTKLSQLSTLSCSSTSSGQNYDLISVHLLSNCKSPNHRSAIAFWRLTLAKGIVLFQGRVTITLYLVFESIPWENPFVLIRVSSVNSINLFIIEELQFQ